MTARSGWARMLRAADVSSNGTSAMEPDALVVAALAQELLEKQRARELLAAQQAAGTIIPPDCSLADLLAEPDEPLRERIQGLWPDGGNVLLAAPRKAGKTSLVLNVARSLADGDRFLGAHDTEQLGDGETVQLIDLEMPKQLLKRWVRRVGIQNDGRVRLRSLRGYASSLNIVDANVRSMWARDLKASRTKTLIIDCLEPIMDALGLDKNQEAGRFLVALDLLKAEAEIPNLLLAHHFGHSNERAKGDSRLEGWPDALWKIVLDKPDDLTSQRYFSAFGRDVDVPEAALSCDPQTHRLTTSQGSRRTSQPGRPGLTEEDRELTVLAAVRRVREEWPGGSPGQIAAWDRLQGCGLPQSAVREAVRRLRNGAAPVPSAAPDLASGIADLLPDEGM